MDCKPRRFAVRSCQESSPYGAPRTTDRRSAATPRPTWNPDVDSPINFYDGWQQIPSHQNYENAFKIEWELFLRHVVKDEPFRWTLLEGAKGVQLAEAGHESWKQRKWVTIPRLET